MQRPSFESVANNYQGLLSLCAFLVILAIPFAARYILRLIPALREVQTLNTSVAEERHQRGYYTAIQKRSLAWGLVTQLTIFALIIPFTITGQPQSLWQILLDMFIILMFYDFFTT